MALHFALDFLPEQALGGIPLDLGMVAKINLYSYMYWFLLSIKFTIQVDGTSTVHVQTNS